MSDKGYSTGGGKKWLIIIGGVAFVAVLIVIILMAIPPNTYNAVQMLYRTTDSSFLVKDSEENAYETYRGKVNKTPELNRYTIEIKDIGTVAEIVHETLDFYCDYLTFADSNKNLKKNYKVIKNNLSDANEYKENLLELIDEAGKLDDNSTTYMQNMIIDIRYEFVEWLKSNALAIQGLRSACLGSLGQTSENNLAFQITTAALGDAIDVIIEDFEVLRGKDKKGALAQEYQYNITAEIRFCKKFCDTYLKSKADIKSFYFDDALAKKYSTIEKFYSVYREDNFKSVIASVHSLEDNKYTFDKVYENVEDKLNIYDTLKSFLNGGEVK